jgi:pyruvate,water dikinase
MDVLTDLESLCDADLVGNKTANLAQLARLGFNVPPFFAVTAPALLDQANRGELSTVIRRQLRRILSASDSVAVRSSSVEEDGAERSFAGQFDSYLHVAPDQVLGHALKVARSGGSEQVIAYRERTGAGRSRTAPAVLVQRMINADIAGVAFAADPVTGAVNEAVVAAVHGTGDALVSGEVQGDTWRVDLDDRVVAAEVDGDVPVLQDADVVRVAQLAREVSENRGKPQDIEWALLDGELYLLQSRDITATGTQSGDARHALWDNSNIVESYGGITKPLTFTVARSAYEDAYKHLGRVLGIREQVIEQNQRAYEQMIGLIQGRVYYNLLSWYRLLMLTPGFRYNREFMEQMMGVTEGLPEDALPELPSKRRLDRVRRVFDYLRVGSRLTARLLTHNQRVRKFHATMQAILEPVDLSVMSLDELVDYYDRLQTRVIPAWDTPLVNDLFCMSLHGALRRLSERWLSDDFGDSHNELVAGEAAMISLEPVRRMEAMAAIAREDSRLTKMLCNAPVDRALAEIQHNAELADAFEAYLARFGDRCLDELKLESPTLRDDPTSLVRAVGQLALAQPRARANSDARREAGKRVASELAGQPLRHALYRLLTRLARHRVRDRENLRFERTRVYGRVRAVFVEVGSRLVADGSISHPDDVFYLAVDEIAAYVRGTGITGDLESLIAARRSEYQAYAVADEPPRRFVTVGPAQRASSMQSSTAGNKTGGSRRTGQACSQGVVSGRVRIVTDPRETGFEKDEILVAQRTDPGWVTIFPLVKGMIMERGSLLSHSAIVARELSIPAVVGVDDACDWLNDGDWVELDGATGVIRKLSVDEQDA